MVRAFNFQGIADAIASEFMSGYLSLPNYRNNLQRFGYTDEHMVPPYPAHLVDAVTAWGDVETVAARVQEHLDAGADHVSLQVLTDDDGGFPLESLRALAPALRGCG